MQTHTRSTAWSVDLTLDLHLPAQAAKAPRAAELSGWFDYDHLNPPDTIPPQQLTLQLHNGQLIYITGPSGEGKSFLLSQLAEQLTEQTAGRGRVFTDDAIDRAMRDNAAQLLIDTLGMPAVSAMRQLSRAGLSDLPVMLRPIGQLSAGERLRAILAQLFVQVTRHTDEPTLVVFDEFASVLDRQTAKLIARRLRRWVNQTEVCCVVATAHDDLLETLAPDVMVDVRDGRYRVMRQQERKA